MQQDTKKIFDEILKSQTLPLGNGEELALIEEFNRLDPIKDGERRMVIINKILLSWDPQFKKIGLKVYSQLNEGVRKTISLDDIIQEARLIAIERIHKFNFEKGVKTITYLRPIIERSLHTKWAQNNPGLIRYPIDYEKDALKIFQVKEDLLSEGFYGKMEQFAKAIAERINKNNGEDSIREKRVMMILKNGYQQPISDQTPIGEDDEGNQKTIADYEPATGEGSFPEVEVVNNIVREMKLTLIEQYESEIQFKFVSLLYEGKTVDDIKEQLGIKNPEDFAEAIGEDMMDYYIQFSLMD